MIVPPDDYFPRVREICDRHNVLLIADEVITGFGRTGKWFALEHWDVEPDIMSFAKGVTSRLPAARRHHGLERDHSRRSDAVEARDTWMHAYTYSGHPTCCAVGLANLDIMERERLVERAAETGASCRRGQGARAAPGRRRRARAGHDGRGRAGRRQGDPGRASRPSAASRPARCSSRPRRG